MSSDIETARHGFVAGAAGGVAEIAWVTLYAGVTGGDGAVLARGVTSAVGVSALLPSLPVMLGIIVHLSLAVMVGLLLAFAWRELREQWPVLRSPYPFALAGLAGIWALIFFIVLPIVSPGFVHLVPYPSAWRRSYCLASRLQRPCSGKQRPSWMSGNQS